MLKWFKKYFAKEYKGKIQTLTYYIPAPAARNTSYREKQFDKIIYQTINKGFKVIDIQTIPNSGTNGSGFWAMFTLQATSIEANSLDLDKDYLDQCIEEDKPNSEENMMNDTIEGIYYFD